MVLRLDAVDAGFDDAFRHLLGMKREISQDVDDTVRVILSDVITRGDEALIDYTQKFDALTLTSATLRVSDSEILDAVKACPLDALRALHVAKERIELFHDAQKPQDYEMTDALGVHMGWRWTAVEAAGLYVPGGTASYPSSVLMNAIPARVAGVPRLVMVAPTPRGETNPLVLAAAHIVGVNEVYRIGGAQAIAALAYGTASIAPVAKIVGPGNAYVAAAKRRVFGQVGIDMIAGPSEVLILADGTANPDWIAIDLLAQAEHDPAAQSILITDSEALAKAVPDAVERHLTTLPRAAIARQSWNDYGCIILVPSLEGAVPLVDRLAPEHLEIKADNAEALSKSIRNAGAIFLGAYTPEALGDYVGGPNHVLPTARSSRFSSGLGVLDFMKRTTILSCDATALRELGPSAITLARSEGLEGHARSIAVRLNLS
jgi:histidinol dehydrogenase